jgi:hypothetical protein
MRITKRTADAALTIVAAVAAPALTLCVDTHTITATVATDIGALVAAVVAGWHGGSAAQNRLTTPTVPDET